MVVLTLTSDGRVTVNAHVSSPTYGIRGFITFLVDTGSQKTILGPADAETLGFPIEALPPYADGALFGVGGSASPLDAGSFQIVLGAAEIVAEERLLYFPRVRNRRIGTKGRGRPPALPSILGTDLLRRRRCVLTVDWARGTGAIGQGS